MSTEHNGPYCPVKDKMMLSQNEAGALAGRLGIDKYQCPHCNTWHVRGGHTRRVKKGRENKRRRFRY